MKGEKIACQDLRNYLYGIDNYRQASMLRKGREVHKIYCEVHKGPSFLDDRFTLTEFGKLVLENGSFRAGRAKNVRQIVVARETLYCSGAGTCKRGCGGYGHCLPGCEKIKVRGHKCSFRVKMTMRLGYIDFWYVEVLGDHSNYTVATDTESANRNVGRMLTNYDQLLQGSPSSLSQTGTKSSEKTSSASPTEHLTSVTESYLSKSLFTPNSLVSFRHLNVPVFPESFPVSSSQATPPSQSPPQHTNTQLSHLRLPVKQETSDSDSYLARSLLLPYANGHGSGLHSWVQNNDVADAATDVETSSHTMDDSLDDHSSAVCTDEIDGDVDCDVVDEDLSPADNEGKDLATRVRQLEAHVTQLRNIMLKTGETGSVPKKKEKSQRDFDFTKYNTRHVALKIAYLGWDYHGFVVQEDTEKTVESALFDALLKTRLIESRETSNYHRCGRTDKGVSALGQVISLDLRTNLLDGPGVLKKEGGTAHTRQGEKSTEIRYVHILNKVLPPEIRVLAWAPVETSFSARFSCKRRTYKYFFPKGSLDLALMCEAASKLIGEHDFRNLCKMDVANGVVNFKRRIVSAEIKLLDERENGYQMVELTIVGLAFLWHQIRCIMSVLLLVGHGREQPDIIDELLKVDDHPKKPQYTMASEIPLMLYDCDFGDDLEWVYEADWHEDNIKHLQQIWAQHSIRATMIKRMLDQLDTAKVETESDIAPWNELSAPILQQSDWLIPGNKPRVYKPLLQRDTCESLEDRIQHFAKRRKMAHPMNSSGSNGGT